MRRFGDCRNSWMGFIAKASSFALRNLNVFNEAHKNSQKVFGPVCQSPVSLQPALFILGSWQQKRSNNFQNTLNIQMRLELRETRVIEAICIADTPLLYAQQTSNGCRLIFKLGTFESEDFLFVQCDWHGELHVDKCS